MGIINITKDEAQILESLVSNEMDWIATEGEDTDEKGNPTEYYQHLQTIQDKLLEHVEE